MDGPYNICPEIEYGAFHDNSKNNGMTHHPILRHNMSKIDILYVKIEYGPSMIFINFFNGLKYCV